MGELSKVCSKIVLKCLNLARMGRPGIPGQWTNLHDRSQNGPKLVTNGYLVWSFTSITRVITNNIVLWVILQNKADWDCFKTPILQEILRIQNLHQVEHCAFSEVIRLFQSVGCVKKQTSVSHSSTESEIISLDAGLRLDGIPGLDLWDLIVAVLHGNTHQSNQEMGDPQKNPTWKKIPGKIDDLDNVDFTSSTVNSSRKEALLYIFEDKRSSDQDDHKGKKAFNETRFQNPQSCSWLVVW